MTVEYVTGFSNCWNDSGKRKMSLHLLLKRIVSVNSGRVTVFSLLSCFQWLCLRVSFGFPLLLVLLMSVLPQMSPLWSTVGLFKEPPL